MSVRLRPMKDGRGRAGGVTLKVPDVESVECTSRLMSGSHHVLHNDVDGVTRCWYCARTWAELDAEIRAALGWSR